MEKKKIEIIPYLSFNGNCEEAINTYIEAFGGEINFLSRWSEDTVKVTPDQIGKAMHVDLHLAIPICRQAIPLTDQTQIRI